METQNLIVLGTLVAVRVIGEMLRAWAICERVPNLLKNLIVG